MHKPANMRCVTCIMDTSSFFSNLSIDAKRGLQAHLQLKSISKNELLYKEGDACKHLFILVAGEVKVYKSLINGKHQIHKLAQIPGDIIACEDMFMNAHGSSAQALTDVTVCYLKRSELQQCATANREITDTLSTLPISDKKTHSNGLLLIWCFCTKPITNAIWIIVFYRTHFLELNWQICWALRSEHSFAA